MSRVPMRWLVVVAVAVAVLLSAAMGAHWASSHAGIAWSARLALLPQLGTAAAFLLVAIGFVGWLLRRRSWTGGAAILLAALNIAALTAAALSQPVVGGEIGMPASAWSLSHAEPLQPLTALALLTAAMGMAAGVGAKRPGVEIVALGTLGAVVGTVAVFSALGVLGGWLLGDEYGRLHAMSLGSALGLFVTGLGMAALAAQHWRDQQAHTHGPVVPDAAPFAGLAFGALIALTFLAFAWMLNDFEAQMRAKFKRITVNAVDDIGDRMPTYALALRATAHYVRETGEVSRDTWVAHMEAVGVANALPGMLSYGFLEAVSPDRMPGHLLRQRKIWGDVYKIVPEGQREEYFPAVLLEPITEQRRRLMGFDLSSEPVRREAILAARDSGEPTISRNIVLVADRDKPHEYSFQMYMPVYRKGMPTKTVAERRRAIAGIVFTPFRMNEFMRSILLERYQHIRVQVLDGDFIAGAQAVYDSTGQPDGKIHHVPPKGTTALGAIVYGRQWTVLTSPRPSFFSDEAGSGPWIVLVGGVAISLLLGAAIWQVFAIQARVRSLAAAEALHAETESRLRAEQALRVEREEARQKVEALNRELFQRAADLEIANRDLEAFSYSVSHDLQQPVTGIAGYAGMALEEFTGEMSAEVKGFFERIQVASYRMSHLISGLLALSSIARSELHRGPVDLTLLAQEAIAELEATHKLREIEVVIAEGLRANGDQRLLQVLVTNLLSNAWKYTGKTERPRIEMGTLQTPEGLTFFVKDNGAGFEMSKAARLFKAFQRLHKERDFPGTGIGLATVYRIVTRHGGKIWTEAKPGEGATFFFTLPGGPHPSGAARPV